MKMLKKAPHILVGLACLGLLGACSQGQTGATQASPAQTQTSSQKADGKMAADFTLTGVDGKTYKLSDYKGKKVYIKFWASWCSICLASLQDTDELAGAQGEDTVVLSVVSPNHNGEKSEEDFKKWYQSLDYKNLPVLVDPSGQLLKDYGVRSYPTGVFIDREGHLVKTQPGFMEKEAIEKTLNDIK